MSSDSTIARSSQLLTVTDLALGDLLEEWEESIPCQSKHLSESHPECSGPAEYQAWYTCSPHHALICRNLGEFQTERIALDAGDCDRCHQSITECWRVLPWG